MNMLVLWARRVSLIAAYCSHVYCVPFAWAMCLLRDAGRQKDEDSVEPVLEKGTTIQLELRACYEKSLALFLCSVTYCIRAY